MSAPLLVLSYNVSFNAMINAGPGTASGMVGQCPDVGIDVPGVGPDAVGGGELTECAQTMAQLIDNTPAAVNQSVTGYDLVGIQEASRFHCLQVTAKNTLARMGVVYSHSSKKNGPTWLASFYDQNKYTLTRKETSEFSDTRPMHMLVLKHTQGSGGVVYLNIHNGHAGDFDDVARDIGREMAHITLNPAEQNYRIIVTGDFNETGWSRQNGAVVYQGGKLEQTSWTPLSGLGIKTTVSLKSYPCSCCHGKGDWSAHPSKAAGGCSDCNRADIRWGWRGGDYIFDSQADADCTVPPNYDPTKPQSDHLPVMALLPA